MMPVLLVDDSVADASLASRVFAQCHLLNPIRFLASGKECLEFFEHIGRRADKTLPCLVFLDLAMKPVSGLDVLRRLKDDPTAEGSVFVMLSGISDFKILREGYQLGAATFLMKPLRSDDVLRTFKSLKGITVRSTPDGHVLFPALDSGSTAEPIRDPKSAN